MGTRELFLVIGAMVLFGTINLSVHHTIFSEKEIVWKNTCHTNALAIAEQFIEEASTKVFDQAIIDGTVFMRPTDFTSPAALGTDLSETWPNFNDVDDYNCFTTMEEDSVLGIPYNVSIVVGYVDDSNISQFVGTRKLFKRMEVTVTYPTMGDSKSITASRIFADK